MRVANVRYKISDYCNVKVMTCISGGIVIITLLANLLYLSDLIRYVIVAAIVIAAFVCRGRIKGVLDSFR